MTLLGILFSILPGALSRSSYFPMVPTSNVMRLVNQIDVLITEFGSESEQDVV